MPDGIKPSPDAMLTRNCDTLWRQWWDQSFVIMPRNRHVSWQYNLHLQSFISLPKNESTSFFSQWIDLLLFLLRFFNAIYMFLSDWNKATAMYRNLYQVRQQSWEHIKNTPNKWWNKNIANKLWHKHICVCCIDILLCKLYSDNCLSLLI